MTYGSFLCRFLECRSIEAVSAWISQGYDVVVVVAVSLEIQELFQRSYIDVYARNWTQWNHSEDIVRDPLKLAGSHFED